MRGLMNALAPVDAAAARNRGTQNALATMKARNTANTLNRNQAIRQTGQEAAQGGYSTEEHANALRKMGHTDAANKLVQQGQQMRGQELGNVAKGYEIIARTAPLARDQRSWERIKGFWEEKGLAQAGELPDEFDPEIARKLAGKAKAELDIITKKLPGGMAQDFLQRDGGIQPFGEPYERYSPSAMDTDDGDDGLKASDENAMHRYAAGLYGGVYDPTTGEISGLNPDESRNVLAMATRAAQLLNSGEVRTRSEAVSRAARDLNIEVPDLEARTKTQESVEEVAADMYPVRDQPGPTREGVDEAQPASDEPKIIRYDAQGNRIE